jgi:hypothetical protein
VPNDFPILEIDGRLLEAVGPHRPQALVGYEIPASSACCSRP